MNPLVGIMLIFAAATVAAEVPMSYVRNTLGSVVAVTDSAGTVEQAVSYYASILVRLN